MISINKDQILWDLNFALGIHQQHLLDMCKMQNPESEQR